MIERGLSECPVFITNMAALIETISDILHEIDAKPLKDGDRDELNRASSLLSIAHDACASFVEEVERGPDYRLEGGL